MIEESYQIDPQWATKTNILQYVTSTYGGTYLGIS